MFLPVFKGPWFGRWRRFLQFQEMTYATVLEIESATRSANDAKAQQANAFFAFRWVKTLRCWLHTSCWTSANMGFRDVWSCTLLSCSRRALALWQWGRHVKSAKWHAATWGLLKHTCTKRIKQTESSSLSIKSSVVRVVPPFEEGIVVLGRTSLGCSPWHLINGSLQITLLGPVFRFEREKVDPVWHPFQWKVRFLSQ